MPKHQDSLFRQWHMLRLIPRFPRKISAQTLHQTLFESGFEVTQRTVQRDLIELSTVFPLTNDAREKPFGWSWQQNAHNFDLPGLTVQASLMLLLAEQHLSGLLPTSVLAQLKHYFGAAHNRINAEPLPYRSRSWLDKVRTVPSSQPLLAPEIDQLVQDVITDALLHEKQVKISYKKPWKNTVIDYQIHPLALVQRSTVIYLHARIFDSTDTRIFALHRMKAATLLDEDVVIPEGYQVDETIKAGVWGFGNGEIDKVKLVFKPKCGVHLYETKLAKDQQILVLEDKRLQVTATVAMTPQFYWWILGFGDGVEVVEPESLRNKVIVTVQGLANIYSVT